MARDSFSLFKLFIFNTTISNKEMWGLFFTPKCIRNASESHDHDSIRFDVV